jgi:hypothetical protein
MIERVEEEEGYVAGRHLSNLLEGMSIRQASLLRPSSSSRPRTVGNIGVRALIAYDDGLYQASATADDLGPLPRAGEFGEFTEMFRDACKKGFEARAEAARWFYSDHRNFDPLLFGGLEIVDERGRRDLDIDSEACLLVLDGPSGCPGIQLHGRLETVGPGDHRYEFLLQASKLIAGDGGTPERPVAYLFRTRPE